MKSLIFILSLCLCFSCSMVLESEELDGSQFLQKREDQVNAAMREDYQAPFVLDTAYIVDTELWVKVSYSGGCEDHDFMVVWPEVITFIYPPNFSITLFHKNNKDNCEAMITDTLKINLTETPVGEFDKATIAQMKVNVINGSNPLVSKNTR